MVRTPRLRAALGAGEAFGQVVEGLEYQFAGDVTLVFRDDFIAEILFEVLADDEYQFTESSMNGIIDGVVHDGFTMRTQTVELFQTSVAAAHSGSE